MDSNEEEEVKVRKPSVAEKEYHRFFLETLGPSSLVVGVLVCYFCSFDWNLAEHFAFTNEEVEEFAGPSARLLAKSGLDKKTRRVIVSSGDAVSLTAAVTIYVMRILGTLENKQRNNELHRKDARVPNPPKRGTGTNTGARVVDADANAASTGTGNGYVGVDVSALAGFGAHST